MRIILSTLIQRCYLGDHNQKIIVIFDVVIIIKMVL